MGYARNTIMPDRVIEMLAHYREAVPSPLIAINPNGWGVHFGCTACGWSRTTTGGANSWDANQHVAQWHAGQEG